MQITLTNLPHNSAVINESFPFLTTIHFKTSSHISGVVDNVYGKTLCMYLIDPNIQNEHSNSILNVTEEWYNNGYPIPISVIFEQLGLKQHVSPLCKMLNFSNISNIDGPVFSFHDKPALIKKHQIRVEK